MGRLKTQVGWLVRGSSRTNAAFAEIQQLRAQLDQLSAEVAMLRGDLEAAREESRGSVGDLTDRIGAVNQRLESLGG